MNRWGVRYGGWGLISRHNLQVFTAVPESSQSHVTCMWLHDIGGIFYLYDMLTIQDATEQTNGIYFAVMKAGGITKTEKMMLVK